MKKGALVNFTKFTGKHLCQSLFFNKVKETPAQVFSCEFGEISKNTLFTEHLCTTASDFICGVFFKFSIIKSFRIEKCRFQRKKSTSGYSLKRTKFVMIDIKYRFTCGDSDVSEIIKKCQNIMTRIVA